jgi:hypothetical protein
MLERFYSNKNYELLKSVIFSTLQKDNLYQSNQQKKYEKEIKEMMRFVGGKVSDTPPDGYTEKDYIMLINKKVYSLYITKIRKEKEEKEKERKNKGEDKIKRQVSVQIQNENTLPIHDFDDIQEINYQEMKSTQERPVQNQNIRMDIQEYIFNEENKNTELPTQIPTHPSTVTPKTTNNITSETNKNDEKSEMKQARETYHMDEINEIKRKLDELLLQASLPTENNLLLNQSENKNLGFSPFLNKQLKSVILPPRVEEKDKSYQIIVNSYYRNKELFPNQNYFEIKFNSTSNSYILETYHDSLGTLIYKGKSIVYGDEEGTNIPITFDNIKQISVLEILCPVVTNYRGGRAPIIYNTAVPATNQTEYFEQYNPIPTRSTGIPQGVFKEPFLFLVIPELEHSYYSTGEIGNRALAKLIPDFSANNGFISVYTSTYTTLRPQSTTEFYRYDPVYKGKIDKFTPTLFNYHGTPFDFGLDKLYIESISQAKTSRYSGYCGPDFPTTEIVIKQTDDSYSDYCSRTSVYKVDCNTLNSHSVVPGDLLYFFNTLPREQDIIYFEDYIQVFEFEELSGDVIRVSAGYYMEESGIQTKINISFPNFIPGGNTNTYRIYNNYYIAFTQKVPGHLGLKTYYFRIVGFLGDDVLIKKTNVFTSKINISLIEKFGFVKNNPQGLQSSDPTSLFYRNGFYVFRVGNFVNFSQYTTENVNPFILGMDFPYEYIQRYFESLSDDYEYQPGDIFFIQHKLQLVYNFEITVSTRNSDDLRSNLEGTGLNF